MIPIYRGEGGIPGLPKSVHPKPLTTESQRHRENQNIKIKIPKKLSLCLCVSVVKAFPRVIFSAFVPGGTYAILAP